MENIGFFKDYELNIKTTDEIDLSGDMVEDQDVAIEASFGLQLYMLAGRDFTNVKRDVGALIGRFGVTAFLNLLFGLIFFKAGSGDDGDMNDFNAHFGAVTMVSISSMFGTAQPTLLSFPFERPMFLREYSTGTYGATAYFLSKWIIEIPMALAQCLVQYILAYNLCEFQGDFMIEVLCALGNGLAASSLALVVGCAIPDVKTVTELSPLLFVPQLLFSGFFVRTSMIPLFMRWAQYLCALKYSLNLILLTEFSATNSNCEASDEAKQNCATVLRTNDVHHTDWWFYLIMLLLIFSIFRLIAGLILVQKAKKFYMVNHTIF